MMDALSAIDRADIVVLLVDHKQFHLIDMDALTGKALIDTRGLWTWRKAAKPEARVRGGKPAGLPAKPEMEKVA